MPKFIAKIDRSFLIEYPSNNSYFRQNYKPRVMMPIVKYPNGVPEPNEECLVVTSIVKRMYNNILKKYEAGPGSYKIVIKIYRLEKKPPYPIKFVLRAGRIAKYMKLPDVYKVIQSGTTRFEKLLVYTTKEDTNELQSLHIEREENSEDAKADESNA